MNTTLKRTNSLGFLKSEKETKVVVAMSGGVDSSTVAGLMKKDGYKTKKGELKHSFGTPDPVAAGKKAGKSHQKNYQHFAESLIPEIKKLQKDGITTLAGIAKELNQRGIQTRYNRSWHASSVRNLLIKMKGIK